MKLSDIPKHITELNPDLAGASFERACEMADALHRLCESHGDPEAIKAAFDLSYMLEYLRLNPQAQEDRERLMGTKSEIDAINAHLKSFGAPDSDAYAKTLHLHGAYIQMRGLLLELAEMSQPADSLHGDPTDLQKLHARINRALAETKDL
jgi:hypothetical protein